MRNTVFLGIKHCGKSTQAKLLAEKLGKEFLDSDAMLESAYMEKYSSSSAESTARSIMQKHGEEFFRRFEADVIRDFLNRQSSESCVLALGGGVPCNTFLSSDELKHTDITLSLACIIKAAVPSAIQGRITFELS